MTISYPPGRTATPAELCDEIIRAERALTGRQRPRTLHALCEQAARLIRCGQCGQKRGRACSDAGGLDCFHLGRFAQAVVRDLMTAAEFARVIEDLDVFTAATIIRDGAR